MSSRRRLGSEGPAAFLCCRRTPRAPLPARARVRAARLLQLTPAVCGLVSWAVPVDCPRPAAVAAAPTRAALWSVLTSCSQRPSGHWEGKMGRGRGGRCSSSLQNPYSAVLKGSHIRRRGELTLVRKEIMLKMYTNQLFQKLAPVPNRSWNAMQV